MRTYINHSFFQSNFENFTQDIQTLSVGERKYIKEILRIDGLLLKHLYSNPLDSTETNEYTGKEESDLVNYKERRVNYYHWVLTAVKQNGLALKYAQNGLTADSFIIQCAVKQNPLALEYVSDFWIDSHNKDEWEEDSGSIIQQIYGESVGEDGLLLRLISQSIREKLPVVYVMAFTDNGLSLQFAPEKNNDVDLVSMAVLQNGLALQFAPEHLRNDPDIVKMAVKQNASAVKFTLNESAIARELSREESELACKLFLDHSSVGSVIVYDSSDESVDSVIVYGSSEDESTDNRPSKRLKTFHD